jgi:hypothetical protein
MAKVILEFDFNEDREDYGAAINGFAYKYKFEEVWDEMFRPRHKHGYRNKRLNDLLMEDETEAGKIANEVMDILESIYQDIRDRLHDDI